MVRQPSTEEEAVQITPIIATVRKLCGGPDIISWILGIKASTKPLGAVCMREYMILFPASDSPKRPMMAIKKIKNGKSERMLKKAKYPACSTPSCLMVSMIEIRSILKGKMQYLRTL